MAKVNTMGTLKNLWNKLWMNDLPKPPKTKPGIFEQAAHQIENGHDTGEFGEWLTEYALNALQDGFMHYTLKNIYIPYKDRTSEIDLIMLHEKGIYVFESKNYSGWIYGRENDPQWTQTLRSRDGIQKYRFYNPILQNKTHIKAIEEYSGFPARIKLVSVIVFSERCEFKAIPPNSDNLIICHRDELIRELKDHISKSQIAIPPEKLAEYKRTLEKCTGATAATKTAHIESVSKYKQ